MRHWDSGRRATRRDVLWIGGATLLGAGMFGGEEPVYAVQEGRPAMDVDICVYCGNAAGVITAIQAVRMGKRVVLIEPGRFLGGMTTGGLGQTDFGNRGALGGLSRQFYRRVRQHYVDTYGPDSQQVKDCHDGFRFEPHVADKILRDMMAETKFPVVYGQRLKSVRKRGNRITELVTENGARYRAKMYVDCSYEGDLMAAAGVSYTVGREASSKYGETLNGIQFGHPHHNFQVPVDPYVVPGNPSSGLLQGISNEEPGQHGEGDHRVQAYNYRMCLSRNPENQLPFPKPEGYDPERYTLLARYLNAGVWDVLRLSTPMPNAKTDTNNYGGFSTDNIGMNYEYPDGDWSRRERIVREHVTYQQGLMWFLCHDERVPEPVRAEVNRLGLAKDEFRDTGGWPHQLYVREARRMVSDYVMTEHNCRGKERPSDAVALAAYTMDSHHVRRIVLDGMARNEGDVQVGGFPPYPISYRSIVPKEHECANLLVPVCLSSSHISYGSIRMEPVFMILGQSAATAAVQAINARCSVQQVDISRLQEQLRRDEQILEWQPAEAVPTLPGIVLDDQDAKRFGSWRSSSLINVRRVGTGYIHDGNESKGTCLLVYAPEIPEAGEYEIVLISPPNANRATNVPVTVRVAGEELATVLVNQRIPDRGGFASLGKFRLPSGRQTTVTISNRDTDGFVVADGIQFLPVSG